jgi:excisionase family DNA binding protein
VLNRKTAELRDELRFPPLDDATRRISTRWRAETAGEIIAMIEQWVGLADLTVGQPSQLWIAVEKRGLVPRMERAFTELYGIPVVPLGGFASQPLRAKVRRLVAEDGRPAHLFHAADFDPSGWFLGRSFAEKSRIDWASVTRVALTPEQVAEYEIPPNPAPSKDSRLERFVAETGSEAQIEVNALEVVRPGLLAELFWQALEPHWDDRAYKLACKREQEHRIAIISDPTGAQESGDVSEPLVRAMLDLLRPEVERRVRELVAAELASFTLRQPDPWMTVEEGATYLKLSPEALRALLRRKSLPGYRDEGRWLLDRRELDAHLHGSQTGSGGGATIQDVIAK